MKQDPVEKSLREILRGDEAPPFAEMWARAQVLADEGQKSKAPSYGLLLRGAAVAGTVAVALALYWITVPVDSGSTSVSTVGEKAEKKPSSGLSDLREWASLTEENQWTSVFEELESDWEIELSSPSQTEGDNEEQTKVATAISRSRETQVGVLGEELVYESPTDFLLQLEIPVWKNSEERSVL